MPWKPLIRVRPLRRSRSLAAALIDTSNTLVPTPKASMSSNSTAYSCVTNKAARLTAQSAPDVIATSLGP